MGKGKPRLYPDKPQNNYPTVCLRYEDHGNGVYYCEEGYVGAAKICKGNPHIVDWHQEVIKKINDGVV